MPKRLLNSSKTIEEAFNLLIISSTDLLVFLLQPLRCKPSDTQFSLHPSLADSLGPDVIVWFFTKWKFFDFKILR